MNFKLIIVCVISTLVSGYLIILFYIMLSTKHFTEFQDSFSSYYSVVNFLSSGRVRFLKYYTYRLLPPSLILIFHASILSKSGYYQSPFISTVAVLISLIPTDIKALRAKKISKYNKMVHYLNIFLLLTISVVIGSIAYCCGLSIIAPSLQGMVDNLWSNLLTALLIVFFLKKSTITDEKNYLKNSIIKIEKKFGNVILEACGYFSCSPQLLKSILVIENMNRPYILRTFERLYFFFSRHETTMGIAQVKSNRIITDKESIYLAAEILKGTNTHTYKSVYDIEKVLSTYNGDPKYSEEVYEIYIYILNFDHQTKF